MPSVLNLIDESIDSMLNAKCLPVRVVDRLAGTWPTVPRQELAERVAAAILIREPGRFGLR